MQIRVYFLLFVLNTCVCEPTLSQSYDVNYKVIVHKNRNQLPGVSQFTQSVFDEMDSLNVKLLFDKEKSIFKDPENIEFHKYREKAHKAAARLIIGLTHTYYFDMRNKEAIELQEFNNTNYVIKSKPLSPSWQITNEKKILNGYSCLKATTTKEYISRMGETVKLEVVAWYTEELPFSFGPKGYIGLPGLILELHEGSNRFSYIATEIKSEKSGTISFTIPNNFQRVTKEQFQKVIKKGLGSFNQN